MIYRSPGRALPAVLSWISLFCYVLLAVASSFVAAPRVEAQSLQLIDPSSAIASTDQNTGRVAGATIDDSGLNFLGGDVNDPSQYTVTGGANPFGVTNNWLSSGTIADEWLIVDLGQSFSLAQMSLFNFNTSNGSNLDRGVNEASIFYFDGAVAPGGNTNDNMTAFDSTNWISLGDFTFTIATNPTQTTPDAVDFNGANAQYVAIDINSNHGGSLVGIGELQFFELIPDPGSPITVIDMGAINQLVGSAIPMNQAIGQIASNVHNVGGRSLNQRIHRLRSRIGGMGNLTENRIRRGREVAAARLYKMERDLQVSNTIDLNTRKSGTVQCTLDDCTVYSSLLEADVAPTLLPTVTQQAGHSCSPDTLACGERWEVFASADFGNYELDNLGGNPGIDSHTYASTAGIEYILTENLAIGAGWSHVWNDNTLTNGSGGVDIEGDAAMAYASYFKNNLWGDIFYSYGDYEADITRYALGSTMRATPDIEAHQTTLNLGYNIPCEDRFVHGPTFRANYSWGQLDGYTETGNTRFNTTFREQDYRSLITTLGWQLNWRHDTCWGAMRPQFRVGYGRENLNQETNVNGVLQNSPITVVQGGNVIGTGANNPLSLTRDDPGEGWMEFGAGMGFDFNNNFSLLVDYQGRFFQQDAQLHLGTVKASWRW